MSPRVREDSVHPRLQSDAHGRPLNFTGRRHQRADLPVRPIAMKEAIVTSGVVAALFLGLILFEAGAKSRILTANPYNQPTFKVAPSLLRYIAVLGVATFLALQIRHYRLPYWSAVAFGIAFVVWWALLLWDVSKEMTRQRKLRESRDGAS